MGDDPPGCLWKYLNMVTSPYVNTLYSPLVESRSRDPLFFLCAFGWVHLSSGAYFLWARLVCGCTFPLIVPSLWPSFIFFRRRDSWDASLLFVLGFGVMVSLAGFPLVTRWLGAPLCHLPAKNREGASITQPHAEKFEIPTNTEVPLHLYCYCSGGSL